MTNTEYLNRERVNYCMMPVINAECIGMLTTSKGRHQFQSKKALPNDLAMG
jgi:hypothetical protein